LASARQALLLGRPQFVSEPSQMAVLSYREAKNDSGEAKALTTWGLSDFSLNRLDQASIHLTLAMTRPAGAADTANAKVALAHVLLARGDATGATDFVDEALPELRDAGDLAGQAFAIDTFGKIAEKRGNHALAARQVAQAIELYKQAGDTSSEAYASSELLRISDYVSEPVVGFVFEHWRLASAAAAVMALIGCVFAYFRVHR
jgi:tetratricopeptide (TPR) repeat protein